MLTLDRDTLHVQFPDVHPEAECFIEFERTLRIPDDNRTYPLPPKLGHFPLRLVDDYQSRLPEAWGPHGGVFLPMYQSEALWIDLHPSIALLRAGHAHTYPCVIKIATGLINAVSGEPWTLGLQSEPQDYVVNSKQRWLDGYNVAKGLVRQFVAAPPGAGYSVEEQLTGADVHGGLQIAVYPMKAEVFEAYRAEEERKRATEPQIRYGESASVVLSAGGLIRQDIVKDPHGRDAWDQNHVTRCFVHLINAEQYQAVTGEPPPQRPFRAKDYAEAGLPWFHEYSDGEALPGAEPLSKVSSLAAMTVAKTGQPMPDNGPLGPLPIRTIGKAPIREGSF